MDGGVDAGERQESYITEEKRCYASLRVLVRNNNEGNIRLKIQANR